MRLFFRCHLKRFLEEMWASENPKSLFKVAPQISMTADAPTDNIRTLHLNAVPAQRPIFLKGTWETFHAYFSFL